MLYWKKCDVIAGARFRMRREDEKSNGRYGRFFYLGYLDLDVCLLFLPLFLLSLRSRAIIFGGQA
jgi:hypothetical protein